MENAQKKSSRRLIEGVVVSDKMQKTIVVEVAALVKHPKYGKYYKKFKRFKAHDEAESAGLGDRVSVIESKPISRQKRFRLVSVLEKAKVTNLIGDEGSL